MLASPALGDIQLSMQDKRGHLEVEVIRARGLQCKPGSKTLPGTNYKKLGVPSDVLLIKTRYFTIN